MATSRKRTSRTKTPDASQPNRSSTSSPSSAAAAGSSDEAAAPADGERAAPTNERARTQISDLMRRALLGGVEAVLSGEDGVRDVLSGVQDALPRDVSQRLVGQVDAVRREVSGQVDAARREALGIVAREMRGFLDTINISEELEKILTTVSFEVRMQVRFVPNDEGRLRAEVRPAVGEGKRSKRRREARSAAAEAEAEAPSATVADEPAARAEASTDEVSEVPPHEPGSEPRVEGHDRRGEQRFRRAASVARSAGLQAVDTVFRVAERTTSALADLDEADEDDDDFRDFRELVDD